MKVGNSGNRAQDYDMSAHLTSERLPTENHKAFGAFRKDVEESKEKHVSIDGRDYYTPRLSFTDELDPRLVWSNGEGVKGKYLPYVVVKEEPRFPNGRLLIERDNDLNHADLAGGGEVLYAGEMDMDEQSIMTKRSRRTGHYMVPDKEWGRVWIETNSVLTPEQKAEALKTLDERAPEFEKLEMDKFVDLQSPKYFDYQPSERPTTPPLDIELDNR